MALGLDDFDEGKSITQAIGRGRPWKSDFLSPNGTQLACCYFRAQKSLNFQGPTLPVSPEIDLYNQIIKIITSSAI